MRGVAVRSLPWVVASCLAAPALGQDPSPATVTFRPADMPHPETYGTADRTSLVVGAWEFVGSTSDVTWGTNAGGARFVTGGGGQLNASPRFPNGALVEVLELHACDTSPTEQVVATFQFCQVPGGVCIPFATASTGGPQTFGCGFFQTTFSPVPFLIESAATHVLTVTTGPTNATFFTGVRAFYRLQVSEAPDDATFGDVPTNHQFFRYVEALAASGITGGCGGGNFCPNNPVTRGQMAAFLSIALGLHFPN
jgi:S-layer homology domain